jgi:hypothetical protein
VSQLTTVTEEQLGADEVPNNPAGRVLHFLRAFQQVTSELSSPNRRGPTAVKVIQQLTGEKPKSTRMQMQIALFRVQAESVQDLMKPGAGDSGHRMFFSCYDQILNATSRLSALGDQHAQSILSDVDDAGWAALEYADSMLNRTFTEKQLSADEHQRYLDDLRGLIDEVLNDDTLSPQDRERIVGLLRQVEDALVHIRLFGADRVQDAAAAAAGVLVTDRDLWDRIAKKKWVKRFGAVIGGLLFALGSMEGVPAIEQMLSPGKPQIVVVQQDQNGQHANQPTDQPTPR